MEKGIEHLVLWSTIPMEKEEIECYIEQEMPGFEYLWFVNPVELRSVLDVSALPSCCFRVCRLGLLLL